MPAGQSTLGERDGDIVAVGEGIDRVGVAVLLGILLGVSDAVDDGVTVVVGVEVLPITHCV